MQTSLLATIGDSRLTYLVILVAGMALCTTGIGRAAARGLWLHPLSIVGYVLGAAALLLIVQGLFRVEIVPVASATALALIFGIIVVKIIVAQLYPP